MADKRGEEEKDERRPESEVTFAEGGAQTEGAGVTASGLSLEDLTIGPGLRQEPGVMVDERIGMDNDMLNEKDIEDDAQDSDQDGVDDTRDKERELRQDDREDAGVTGFRQVPKGVGKMGPVVAETFAEAFPVNRSGSGASAPFEEFLENEVGTNIGGGGLEGRQERSSEVRPNRLTRRQGTMGARLGQVENQSGAGRQAGTGGVSWGSGQGANGGTFNPNTQFISPEVGHPLNFGKTDSRGYEPNVEPTSMGMGAFGGSGTASRGDDARRIWENNKEVEV